MAGKERWYQLKKMVQDLDLNAGVAVVVVAEKTTDQGYTLAMVRGALETIVVASVAYVTGGHTI